MVGRVLYPSGRVSTNQKLVCGQSFLFFARIYIPEKVRRTCYATLVICAYPVRHENLLPFTLWVRVWRTCYAKLVICVYPEWYENLLLTTLG